MSFYSYENIPDKVLDEKHKASTGEIYSLRHSEQLKVEMQYIGVGNQKANSQGWERDKNKYFQALYTNHPEMFSKKNIARLNEGDSPIVDQKMIDCNPNWAAYRNQMLIHHHIGGNGEAVAVPENIHKGQGEIHNYEKDAGITENCKVFSQECASRQESIGKTTSELHSEIGLKNYGNSESKRVSFGANTAVPAKESKQQEDKTRSEAVRDILADNRHFGAQISRSQCVRNAVESGKTNENNSSQGQSSGKNEAANTVGQVNSR